MARAEEANRLLNGPIMEEAFARAEADFVRGWKESENPARRETFWAQMAGLEEVKRHLRRVINQGEYASLNTDE